MNTGIFKTLALKTSVLSILLLASYTVTAESKPAPSYNHSELNEIKVKGFDRAAGLERLDISQFDGFMVKQADLEFDRHWLREHKFHMSDNDEKRLREDYTRVLKEALENTLQKHTPLEGVFPSTTKWRVL